MRTRWQKARGTAARRLRVCAVSSLLAATAFAGEARAATDACYEGGDLLPNFKLNGNAELNGTDVIVTQALGNQRASVMYYPTFSTASDLHIAMQIKISMNGNGGADGMAFVMHDDPAGPSALGAQGLGIGYEGITKSVVVELDTYQNAGDPNANHIAITRGGDPVHTDLQNFGLPVVSNPNGITLKSGAPIFLWIDYAHATTELSVYLATTNTKPATAAMATAIDLSTAIGPTFYAGFTASTGGSWSQHEVIDLFASDHFGNPQDGCCATNADCASSAAGPVCDPVKHLCGGCTEQDVSHCMSPNPACDLSSSSDQCSPACNGNTGSGASHACSSQAFPACTPTGSCATCNGDYQTTASVACGVGAPFCSATGYCGLCTTNADCTGASASHSGVACDVATGACVACTTDANCGQGFYCNGTTLACTPTLADGSPIPNDPLHGGTCTTATGKAVCTTGVCDTDNDCGLASGHGPCTTTAQCRAGVCATSGANAGKCEPCAADTDCPSGLVCNTTTNQCVTCTAASPAACKTTTPVCNVATNGCVACNGDNGSAASHDCPSAAAPYCATSGACGKCTSNADCSSGTHAGALCNTASGVCGTACTVDADCPGEWCDNPTASPGGGACSVKIANGEPVPPSAPIGGVCTTAVGTRVCASGVCDTSDDLCGEPNSRPCATATVCRSAECNADGKCGDPNGTACTTAITCRTAVCETDGKCGQPNGQPCTASAICRSLDCVAADGVCGALSGAPCSAGADCRSGTCAADGRCGSPNGQPCTAGFSCRSGACVSGVCSGICDSDAECLLTTFCDATSRTCLPDVRNGGGCTRAAQCWSGVCNADGKCGNPNGTACTLNGACRSAACIHSVCGVTCTADADCGIDSYCNAGTCAPGVANGQACTKAAQCASGVCASDSSCGALTGAPCATAAACRSGICDPTGTCAAQCAQSVDCAVGAYCDTASHACVPAASNGQEPEGQACSAGAQCLSGDCDKDGKCGGTNSEACGSSLLCRSGVCDLVDTSCGLANGDGPCATASDCRSSECDTTVHKCAACLTDSDCPGSTCNTALGMCASIPDAGMSADAASDASTDDNVDAGNEDGGEEDATVDSSVSPTDSGEVADSGTSTPGAEGQSTSSPGDNGLSMRGGGFNCTTAGGTSPVSGLSGLGAGLALAIAGMRRRASRRERHERNHERQRRGEG